MKIRYKTSEALFNDGIRVFYSMKYFVIFFLILLSAFSLNEAFASCGKPYDFAFHWIDYICDDTGQTDEQRKADWAEFYYFKGSQWMKYKTNEFETLMKDGFSEDRLREWVDGQGYGYVPENWYFWNYYELFGSNPPQTKQKPVEIPLLEKQTCDESCKDRITESVNPYTCTKKPYSQNYECAHQSAMQPTILLTSTDETGKEMTFRPTEATVSLGINNTIRWHNTSYKTTISNQEAVYEPLSIPFDDIKYQVLDKVGNYTFYDESNPNTKISINVVPLDASFNAGKPVTKHGYFSDVRFQIFRTNTDSQNFIHSLTIHDNSSIEVTLDNTMDTQYAVHYNLETLKSAKISVGETIISGCSYHHDAYSRLFYHTLEKINSQNDTVEFKETVDYVQGNQCESLYSDPARIIEAIHKNNILQSPLKQFDSGISFNEIQCKQNLVLLQKYDSSPACVTEQTKQKLIERGWAKDDNMIPTFDYVIEKDGVIYGSQYQISGGIVDEIFYDKYSNSLVIPLRDSEKGFLQIVIQTGLLHSLEQMPFTYFVIVDGEEIVFEQLSPIIVKIPFEKETKQIEIIGTPQILENENTTKTTEVQLPTEELIVEKIGDTPRASDTMRVGIPFLAIDPRSNTPDKYHEVKAENYTWIQRLLTDGETIVNVKELDEYFSIVDTDDNPQFGVTMNDGTIEYFTIDFYEVQNFDLDRHYIKVYPLYDQPTKNLRTLDQESSSWMTDLSKNRFKHRLGK